MTEPNTETLLGLTADIVASHVANNNVASNDLPSLISNVYSALSGLNSAAPSKQPEQEPAVSIRSSIRPDYLVCLEDGKKLKMLKRHLMTHYQMTPSDYRAKWKLPADYPMVAPNYAAQRRKLAHDIGLGRKPQSAAPVKAGPTPAKAEAAPAKAEVAAPAKAKRAAAKPKTPAPAKPKAAAVKPAATAKPKVAAVKPKDTAAKPARRRTPTEKPAVS